MVWAARMHPSSDPTLEGRPIHDVSVDWERLVAHVRPISDLSVDLGRVETAGSSHRDGGADGGGSPTRR